MITINSPTSATSSALKMDTEGRRPESFIRPLDQLPFLRRTQASEYLEQRWGFRCKPKTMAKLAVKGGGPAFRKAGKFPIYETADLDAWAEAKIGPKVNSTSELRGV